MPNRTIYVKDPQLWEKAKKLAGKGGLSEVISNALQGYVAEKEAQAKGLETQRIVVQPHPDIGGSSERIAFRGRSLGETNSVDVTATIWETEGGRFVMTLESDLAPHVPCFYYVVGKHLSDLGEDDQVRRILPQVDKWLAEVEIARAQTGTSEVWIDDVSLE